MALLINILIVLAIVVAAFFVLTFTMYIFNLDMKMMAVLYKFFDRHYDKVKRDKHL